MCCVGFICHLLSNTQPPLLPYRPYQKSPLWIPPPLIPSLSFATPSLKFLVSHHQIVGITTPVETTLLVERSLLQA
ncbi:hypothetical protein BDV98DRAFT_570588 [Pterulicium gracile]|uniref:Uncharacterized protein n=1 Tax=Pterulicium gracile TaxID=1884261 RepID=A0A5C3QC25_9AGAR|nr:hypothetical protein BDV98DRAFT_570588 [Pterula gracilis]